MVGWTNDPDEYGADKRQVRCLGANLPFFWSYGSNMIADATCPNDFLDAAGRCYSLETSLCRVVVLFRTPARRGDKVACG